MNFGSAPITALSVPTEREVRRDCFGGLAEVVRVDVAGAAPKPNPCRKQWRCGAEKQAGNTAALAGAR